LALNRADCGQAVIFTPVNEIVLVLSPQGWHPPDQIGQTKTWERRMDDKMKTTRFAGSPNLGMAVVLGAGRVNTRELMRRKLMRKMMARRLRNAEMASAK
jgi:hypothetical protein